MLTNLQYEISSTETKLKSTIFLAGDQLLNGRNGIFAEPLANSPSNITASDASGVVTPTSYNENSNLFLKKRSFR